MTETPQHLLDELREVLGPMLCGLSDDDTLSWETLMFAEEQLQEYLGRIKGAYIVTWKTPAEPDTWVSEWEEGNGGDDTEP